MKRIISLLCLCTMLCCLFLSNAYAASTADETPVPDAPAAVTVDDNPAEQPLDINADTEDQEGEALHVKASPAMEENAVDGEEAAE